MAIKKRLPKNQWLMSRRFVSLADRCKKLSKMVNKLHLSGKEQIRLPNNHWFFGRRNCKVHFKKTNGFKASCAVSHARGKRRTQRVHVLKTHGFKACCRVSQLAYRIGQILYMASIGQLHGKHKANGWQTLYMANIGQMHCKCSATAWQLHGNCIANACQTHSKCMATAWQLQGK